MIFARVFAAGGIGYFSADAFTHTVFSDSGQSAVVAALFVWAWAMFAMLDN